ncbi:MAG: hypothetical protein ACRDJL_11065 [Actinomycetota bacterium]
MTARDVRSALEVLSASEKAAVLDALLAARPSLRSLAEKEAARLLDEDDAESVAESLADDLRAISAQEVWSHPNNHMQGRYMDEGEIAWEMLAEVLTPYIEDVARLGEIGNRDAAQQVCLGILMGLYECRDDENPDLALGRLPASDFAVGEARGALDTLRRVGGKLPAEALSAHCPDWDRWLGPPRQSQSNESS